ncbi:hypothetical protein [Micromonospora maritima]|uniref:hypothetical protein n=1 Tax=Micromonospora maritima TaxID=986711 RepID=UPI00157E085F|nr:hypothetical protein [Micromonospora maritima]
MSQTVLQKGELYPVAPGEPLPRGAGRQNLRVKATGEKRPPRKGEWYLSGATIEGYRAPNDLTQEHQIGELVEGETVTIWRSKG